MLEIVIARADTRLASACSGSGEMLALLALARRAIVDALDVGSPIYVVTASADGKGCVDGAKIVAAMQCRLPARRRGRQ